MGKNRITEVNIPATHTSRFTSYPGIEMSPALSPDGMTIAFSWNGLQQDNFDIYRKSIDGPNPVRLTTNSLKDDNPVWSGDNKYLAFNRVSDIPGDLQNEIYIIPSLGGKEQKIATYGATGVFSNLSWSNDNQ